MKSSKSGFIIPLLIIIIAVLAIGGGVYMHEKNKKIATEQTSLNLNASTTEEIQVNTPNTDNQNTLTVSESVNTNSKDLSNFNTQLDPNYSFGASSYADFHGNRTKELASFEVNKNFQLHDPNSVLTKLIVIDNHENSGTPFVIYKEDYTYPETGDANFQTMDLNHDGKQEMLVTASYQAGTLPFQQTVLADVNGQITSVSKVSGVHGYYFYLENGLLKSRVRFNETSEGGDPNDSRSKDLNLYTIDTYSFDGNSLKVVSSQNLDISL